MGQIRNLIHLENRSGAPMTIGEVTITPQSQALSIRWPSRPRGHAPNQPPPASLVGWVWNRPTAVLVEQKGQARQIPVVDVTRMAQLSFWAAAAVFAGIAWLLRCR